MKRPPGELEECLEIPEFHDRSRSPEGLSLSKRKRAHPAPVEDHFQGKRCVVNLVRLREASKYNVKPQKADQGVRSRCVVNLRRLDSEIFSKPREDIETVQEQVKVPRSLCLRHLPLSLRFLFDIKLKTFQANEMESLSGDQSSFTEKSCSVRVAKMGLSTILKYAMGRGRELGMRRLSLRLDI